MPRWGCVGFRPYSGSGLPVRRLLRAPTGEKAFWKIEPLKGDAPRSSHGNILQCALRVGGERGMIARSVTGRLEYHSSISPFDAPPPNAYLFGVLEQSIILLAATSSPAVAFILNVTIDPRAAPLPITGSSCMTALTWPLFRMW